MQKFLVRFDKLKYLVNYDTKKLSFHVFIQSTNKTNDMFVRGEFHNYEWISKNSENDVESFKLIILAYPNVRLLKREEIEHFGSFITGYIPEVFETERKIANLKKEIELLEKQPRVLSLKILEIPNGIVV